MHTHVRNELWTYTSGEIGPRTSALNFPSVKQAVSSDCTQHFCVAGRGNAFRKT